MDNKGQKGCLGVAGEQPARDPINENFLYQDGARSPAAAQAIDRFFRQSQGEDFARTPEYQLWQGILWGDKRLVENAIEKGADVKFGNNGAVILAASLGQKDVVESLAREGADLNARNGMALRMAIQNGHTDAAKALVEKGADIHVMNEGPLGIAVKTNNAEMVDVLLARGAGANARSGTDLQVAVRNNNAGITGALLDKGAGTEAQRQGLLAEAARRGQENVAREFTKRGVEPRPPQQEADVVRDGRLTTDVRPRPDFYNARDAVRPAPPGLTPPAPRPVPSPADVVAGLRAQSDARMEESRRAVDASRQPDPPPPPPPAQGRPGETEHANIRTPQYPTNDSGPVAPPPRVPGGPGV